MVLFALLKAGLPGGKPAGHFAFQGKIFQVFLIAFLNVATQNTEITIDKQEQAQPVQDRTEKRSQHNQNQRTAGQKPAETVKTVAAGHKALQPGFHGKNHLFGHSPYIRLSLWHEIVGKS